MQITTADTAGKTSDKKLSMPVRPCVNREYDIGFMDNISSKKISTSTHFFI